MIIIEGMGSSKDVSVLIRKPSGTERPGQAQPCKLEGILLCRNRGVGQGLWKSLEWHPRQPYGGTCDI